MSYIDVLIPGVGGLLLVLSPGAFAKRKGELVADEARTAKLRKVGFALLGIAAMYLLIKLSRTPEGDASPAAGANSAVLFATTRLARRRLP